MERLGSHMEGDKEVSLQERHKLEEEMNATSLQWGRMLRLWEKWNGSGRHGERVGAARRTRCCMAPPLYGLPKDHKPLVPGEEHLGPPLRPVCGCTESINKSLSQLLTEILTTLGDRADTNQFITRSTEEVMEAFTRINTTRMDNPVIFSLDVDAMYPRLDREEVARPRPSSSPHQSCSTGRRGRRAGSWPRRGGPPRGR